jgi:hypothetical protein
LESTRFELPEAGQATLKIFNLMGAEVMTLVGQRYDAGKHAVTFQPNNVTSDV